MPKTLLAVDDSATMRKVLEITFAGEDFQVVSADGASTALARLGDDPAVAVIDMSLGGDDGYALAKEVRSRDARIALVLMASRYNPYDANRGRDAGVDDFIDKPFDTQTLIDKVKKAITAREAVRSAAPAAPVPTTTVPLHTPTAFGGPVRPPMSPPASAPKPAAPTQRTHTLSFEGSAPAAPPPTSAPSTLPRSPPFGAVAAPARPAPAPIPAMATLPPAAPVGLTVPAEAPGPVDAREAHAQANGRMAGRLDELGLTPEQVKAVLALSRELVERVVWEVVPQLAEAMIKEEITRLTKET